MYTCNLPSESIDLDSISIAKSVESVIGVGGGDPGVPKLKMEDAGLLGELGCLGLSLSEMGNNGGVPGYEFGLSTTFLEVGVVGLGGSSFCFFYKQQMNSIVLPYSF